jgi:hypothetical protein
LESGEAENVKLRLNHMRENGEIPEHVPEAAN